MPRRTVDAALPSPPGEPQAAPDDVAARLASALTAALEAALAAPLPPGLHLVATPIGNLADISVRALSVLARADWVFCEDTRRSRILFDRYGLRPAHVGAYHEHNGERERPRILALLKGGAKVALVSDGGTPLVSDPGFKLVRAALAEGLPVHAVPGASAVLAALTVAGLPTDSFHFAGFLPPRSSARKRRLGELKEIAATLVLFETGNRLAEALADMAEVLGARPAAIARELPKLNEATLHGPLDRLAAGAKPETLKGEIVVVVGGAERLEVDEDTIKNALEAEPHELSLKDRVERVANRLGVAKRKVYDLAILVRGS